MEMDIDGEIGIVQKKKMRSWKNRIQDDPDIVRNSYLNWEDEAKLNQFEP